MLNAKIPSGPLENKWADYKGHCKLVNPDNKRKLEVIVVGTGLAGASAAASLGELGYKVKAFCFQDSPRRAHSIAAQGGINAAKNYQNDGDSVFRLFYDTIKGGDYRAREANVHRLAEVSTNIIDQCVAQGVPFAREYGGLLSNRSFGGTQVQRTFYAAGQTGQQLLIGAYQALERQVALGNVTMYSRHEMLEVVTIEGKARGIIARDLVSGQLERHFGHAVLLCSGGYGNVFYLSTNAMGSNVTAAWKAHKKGAAFANPCFTQIHPTCIPVSGDHQSKLTLMSESLRNDGRIWVPKKQNDTRKATDIPEEERDYYLERRYPAFGNLVPRDVASRAAKERCDAGYGVGSSKQAVYLDYADAILRYGKIEAGKQGRSNVSEEEIIAMGKEVVKAKYGNLFDMYEKITGENPYEVPMRLGKIMWDKCGMARNKEGLEQAIREIQALKKEFWSDVRIPGEVNEMNTELDKANRVADFIELGELMCVDALTRDESCGGHFREEFQTPEGEALRDDAGHMYVSAWELKGEHQWELHKEPLNYEVI